MCGSIHTVMYTKCVCSLLQLGKTPLLVLVSSSASPRDRVIIENITTALCIFGNGWDCAQLEWLHSSGRSIQTLLLLLILNEAALVRCNSNNHAIAGCVPSEPRQTNVRRLRRA